MQRFTVIGVAGGIGSGKSAVARALGRHGAPVFDADASARRILDRPETASQIASRWGAGLLTEDGRVDRAGLAAIVFRDDRARRELEELIHPIVRIEAEAAIDAARAAGARAIVLDIPLLFESGMDALCDIVVFVDADEAVRLGRVSRTRGWSAHDLALREAAQWPLDAKRRRSGVVIVNNGSTESDLEAEAARAYSVACPIAGV